MWDEVALAIWSTSGVNPTQKYKCGNIQRQRSQHKNCYFRRSDQAYYGTYSWLRSKWLGLFQFSQVALPAFLPRDFRYYRDGIQLKAQWLFLQQIHPTVIKSVLRWVFWKMEEIYVQQLSKIWRVYWVHQLLLRWPLFRGLLRSSLLPKILHACEETHYDLTAWCDSEITRGADVRES